MRGFAQHPELEDVLVARHLELRHEDGAIVALAMALERAEQPPPEPARLLGWL